MNTPHLPLRARSSSSSSGIPPTTGDDLLAVIATLPLPEQFRLGAALIEDGDLHVALRVIAQCAGMLALQVLSEGQEGETTTHDDDEEQKNHARGDKWGCAPADLPHRNTGGA